jgi:hypothetical protein
VELNLWVAQGYEVLHVPGVKRLNEPAVNLHALLRHTVSLNRARQGVQTPPTAVARRDEQQQFSRDRVGCMASANVELVRSIYAGWERGDFDSSEWADPEIEYVIVEGPAPGSWKGLTGMAEGFRRWLSAWEEYRVAVDEYRELDEERVLALVDISGRGKLSGVELAQMGSKGAHLFHIHGGKVTRFIPYLDRERAFADLGLPSEADSRPS